MKRQKEGENKEERGAEGRGRNQCHENNIPSRRLQF